MAMLMLSVSSAWAAYVKLTAEDGTMSWIEIEGIINGSNIEIYKPGYRSAIDQNTKGAIDLNEVWSRSGRRGTNYQVTSIGSSAFEGCRGLTSIDIPSSLTSIGESAFSGCSGLTSVDIPSGVISIGSYAFFGCSGLTSIDIPSSLTSIGSSAFSGCSGLTFIVIPSGVTKIGNSAFFGCSGLTSIVVELGNPVYDSRNNCNAIIETASHTLIKGCKNTKIPSSVTLIEKRAFQSCSGLTSVVIPSSVKSIGDYAFSSCSGLTSVTIPSSVSSIGLESFSGCSGLTSVTIPNSVTSIEYGAFSWCSGLTSIIVESGNSVYDSRNNCNAIIETASNALIAGCKNTMIPSSVTIIGVEAFYGCDGLTSVTIPNSVTIIGDGAFSECSGLTSVAIPFSVTSIGSFAFQSCSDLTSVVIPSSVTSIGDGAFSECSGLTSVTSYITNVFETESGAFYGCNNATLFVPRGLASTYRSTADWNRFNNIVESIALAMSCNNKGKVMVNGGVQFTNDMGEVSVYDSTDNTFVFTPEENCQLEQVLIDGLDVTLSVKNNQLTTKVHEGSKMIVTFSKSSGDMNGDGMVNISDVVALVNLILGQ